MNKSKLDKQPEKTHRLTLRESRVTLAMPLGMGLILSALGIGALINRQNIGAVVFCLVALMQFVIVPGLWRRYRQVKLGTAVYVAPPKSEFQMPQIVSLVIVLLVTAFVSVCSAFIFYVVNLYFRTQLGWTICGATLLAVWLFVAYCWYRILTEKPLSKPVLFQEQTEGVWPPAPRAAAEEGGEN